MWRCSDARIRGLMMVWATSLETMIGRHKLQKEVSMHPFFHQVRVGLPSLLDRRVANAVDVRARAPESPGGLRKEPGIRNTVSPRTERLALMIRRLLHCAHANVFLFRFHCGALRESDPRILDRRVRIAWLGDRPDRIVRLAI